MARLITISNRLPISVKVKDGNFIYEQSVGGLATGLSSTGAKENWWVGWPGMTIKPEDHDSLTARMNHDTLQPVFLNDRDYENFYEGFSNKTVWPPFHYFKQYTIYKKTYWEAYRKVKMSASEEVKKIAQPDDVFGARLPVNAAASCSVRHSLMQLLAFSCIFALLYELFRSCPWRKEILEEY